MKMKVEEDQGPDENIALIEKDVRERGIQASDAVDK